MTVYCACKSQSIAVFDGFATRGRWRSKRAMVEKYRQEGEKRFDEMKFSTEFELRRLHLGLCSGVAPSHTSKMPGA